MKKLLMILVSGSVCDVIRKKVKLMNVFIILSILIIVIGVLLLVATPSVLFKLNWKEKNRKRKNPNVHVLQYFGFI